MVVYFSTAARRRKDLKTVEKFVVIGSITKEIVFISDLKLEKILISHFSRLRVVEESTKTRRKTWMKSSSRHELWFCFFLSYINIFIVANH